MMRRLLTPIVKFWICKRGSHFAQEAMECLGGNGYVEACGKGVMARIYREMPLNSIWEGAGNIMALDLLRALNGSQVMDVLMHELALSRGQHPELDRAMDRVLTHLNTKIEEAQARSLVRELALVLQAALLRCYAPDIIFHAFCESRLGQASDVFGLLPKNTDLDAIIERAMPKEV